MADQCLAARGRGWMSTALGTPREPGAGTTRGRRSPEAPPTHQALYWAGPLVSVIVVEWLPPDRSVYLIRTRAPGFFVRMAEAIALGDAIA
jgi:hypothetical protein